MKTKLAINLHHQSGKKRVKLFDVRTNEQKENRKKKKIINYIFSLTNSIAVQRIKLIFPYIYLKWKWKTKKWRFLSPGKIINNIEDQLFEREQNMQKPCFYFFNFFMQNRPRYLWLGLTLENCLNVSKIWWSKTSKTSKTSQTRLINEENVYRVSALDLRLLWEETTEQKNKRMERVKQ